MINRFRINTTTGFLLQNRAFLDMCHVFLAGETHSVEDGPVTINGFYRNSISAALDQTGWTIGNLLTDSVAATVVHNYQKRTGESKIDGPLMSFFMGSENDVIPQRPGRGMSPYIHSQSLSLTANDPEKLDRYYAVFNDIDRMLEILIAGLFPLPLSKMNIRFLKSDNMDFYYHWYEASLQRGMTVFTQDYYYDDNTDLRSIHERVNTTLKHLVFPQPYGVTDTGRKIPPSLIMRNLLIELLHDFLNQYMYKNPKGQLELHQLYSQVRYYQ